MIEQDIAERASIIQESNRRIDRYLFWQDQEGDLYSPTARCKVADVIIPNEVGLLEALAFARINDWFSKNQTGIAVWISPCHPIYYPEASKIIISEICEHQNQKALLNRSIVLDYDQEKCWELAQALSERSINRPFLDSLSAIRSTPLFLNQNNWLDILSEVLDLPDIWQKVRSGQDLIEQKQAIKMAANFDMGVLGSGPLSCPVIFRPLGGIETYFSFPCPKCQMQIPSGRGINVCPFCGARKEDFKKCD